MLSNGDWPKAGPPDPGTPDHVTTKLFSAAAVTFDASL